MTESEGIKKAFVRLRKYNWLVLNFNNKKANNPGIRAHTDWLIGKEKNHLIYVEVKIGKDELSKEQKDFIKMIAWFMGLPNSRIRVYIVKTAKEAEQLSDNILQGKL